MQIRDFKLGDLETLVNFKKESVRISFPGKAYNLDLYRRSLLKAAEREPGTIKVAEEANRIVGYVWFCIKNSATGPHGVINHTFVRPDCRGRGISLKLMKVAEAWFRSKGINRIELQVSNSNLPSLRMCRKLGYKETRVVLEKSL